MKLSNQENSKNENLNLKNKIFRKQSSFSENTGEPRIVGCLFYFFGCFENSFFMISSFMSCITTLFSQAKIDVYRKAL